MGISCQSRRTQLQNVPHWGNNGEIYCLCRWGQGCVTHHWPLRRQEHLPSGANLVLYCTHSPHIHCHNFSYNLKAVFHWFSGEGWPKCSLLTHTKNYQQDQLSPSKSFGQDNSTNDKGAKKVTKSSDNISKSNNSKDNSSNSSKDDDDDKEYCSEKEVVLIDSESLPFGGSRKVVGKSGNLTWGEDVVRPIRCVSRASAVFREPSVDWKFQFSKEILEQIGNQFVWLGRKNSPWK